MKEKIYAIKCNCCDDMMMTRYVDATGKFYKLFPTYEDARAVTTQFEKNFKGIKLEIKEAEIKLI